MVGEEMFPAVDGENDLGGVEESGIGDNEEVG